MNTASDNNNKEKTKSFPSFGLWVAVIILIIAVFLFYDCGYQTSTNNYEQYVTQCINGHSALLDGASINDINTMLLNRVADNNYSMNHLLGIIRVGLKIAALLITASIAYSWFEYKKSHDDAISLKKEAGKAKSDYEIMLKEVKRLRLKQDKEFLLLKAKIYYYEMEYTTCKSVLDSIIDANDPDVIFSKGALAIKQFKYDYAKNLLEEALNKGYRYKADIFLHLGYIDLKNGEWNKAIERFDQALTEHGKHERSLILKAYCLRRVNQGVTDEMIDLLNQVIESNPSNVLAQYNLACYHALRSDQERCKEHLRIAIRIDEAYQWKAWWDKDFKLVKDEGWFTEMMRPNSCNA